MGRHRVDDGLGAVETAIQVLLINLARHLVHAGNHLQQLPQRPHLLDLLHLVAEIFQRKLTGSQFLLRLQRLLLVESGLGLFDQAQHVAHAQNAPAESIRREDFEAVNLLAHAEELDRHARHRAHGDGRAAARVAVHLGQDQAGQAKLLVEAVGDAHRFLAGHRVGHQQNFVRRGPLFDGQHFGHHHRVNLQTSGSVQDDDAVTDLAGVLDGFGAQVGGHVRPAEHRHVNLRAESLQLFCRRRSVGVGGHEQRPVPLSPQPAGQLGGHRRLARALQAHQHDHSRRLAAQIQLARLAQRDDQFFVNDLDHLLAGVQGPRHFGANRALAHSRQKFFDNREVNVGFE